jgi:hypothetical protein
MTFPKELVQNILNKPMKEQMIYVFAFVLIVVHLNK